MKCDSERDTESLSTSDTEPVQKEVGVQTTCTCKCMCGEVQIQPSRKVHFHSKGKKVTIRIFCYNRLINLFNILGHTGIQVQLQPPCDEASVQCTLLKPTRTSTPTKLVFSSFAFSDSEPSDVDLDKQHQSISTTYVPSSEYDLS